MISLRLSSLSQQTVFGKGEEVTKAKRKSATLIMSLGQFIILITLITIVAAIYTKPKQTDDCCEEYCYHLDTSREQYVRFATRGVYEFMRGRDSQQQYSVSGEELFDC